jgi:spore coat protein A, manganese oxidase
MVSVVLAFGVVAWAHVLHLGDAPGDNHLAHILRDGGLALPLALIAVRVTRRPFLRAALFSTMLIPGAVVHRLIESAGGHTHAAAGLPPSAHDVADAFRAFPAALAITVIAGVVRIPAPSRRGMRALALACMAVLAILPVRASADHVPPHLSFRSPLTIPPERTGDDITIDMRAADIQLLPGAPTRMWTYDGMFPGPTIRRPSGAPTRVRFTNNLPAAAGDMTVHHHGGHQASSEDGQPHDYMIPPGGERTYTYDLMEDGAPERGALQWYHDHAMDVTGRNVWNGLAGMVILDDPAEAALPLPSGAYDVPLMIVDRTFDANNQIPYTFSPSGTVGNDVLVNGTIRPYFSVADRRYRFRLLNASNARSYEFDLSNGMSMTQIASESGLLPAPVTRTRLRLGPAERAEIVLNFDGLLGQRIVLRSLGMEVMQFRVETDVATDPSSVPSTLRPARDLAWSPPDRVRTWTLDANPIDGVWWINGKPFEHDRIDARPRLNTTERWVFVNTTGADHVMHIHDVDWKIVSRVSRFSNDPADTAVEQGAKETFLVRPHEIVTLDSRFTDHLGAFMLHCHILEHEDRSMMTQFEVQP